MSLAKSQFCFPRFLGKQTKKKGLIGDQLLSAQRVHRLDERKPNQRNE